MYVSNNIRGACILAALEAGFMSENFKKLTGKNKNDYEQAAKMLVDNCDVKLFKELVEQDEFLFDFIKQNVSERINSAINQNNYKNLLEFFPYYSPYYDDVFAFNLAKYADEDLTDLILEKFESGNNNEKAYAAKYFGYIKDTIAYECLMQNAYSTFEYLARNCAHTLALWNDKTSFDDALSKLKSIDDFEKLTAVRFLVAYGDKEAVKNIINAMKSSTLSENIAAEIPYLMSVFELLERYKDDALIVINNIINGLGEIIPLYSVFDYDLYNLFEELIYNYKTSKCGLILFNALEKFDTLTENDEYLFDEDKETKNEIKDIKHLLKNTDKKFLEQSINDELREDSPFVFTALDYAKDELAVRELLRSNNQTLVLKTAETLKRLGCFDETAKTVALLKITDINIKSIIRAL